MLQLAIEKRLREFELRAAFAAGADLVALFGPSGAGKSVTLRCVAGILRPDAGSIQLDGETVFDAARGIDLPPQRRRVGYVPQSYALFPHLTVAENVGYGLGGLPAAEARARVAAMLARLELDGLEGRRPRELSGGQQQRVALARALVTRPRVLLLDEPFAALDAPLRVRLRRDLLRLQRQLRIPTLFITHDPGEAYLLGERIAVYDRGQVLQAGPREEVWQHPSSARVARLVGFANVLPATVRRDLAAPADSPDLVAVDTPCFRLWAAAAPEPLPAGVAVAIRPEAIVVEAVGSGGDAPNRLPARIVDETCTGVYYTLYCRVLTPDRRLPPAESPPVEHDLEVMLPASRYVELDLLHRRDCTLVVPSLAVRLVGSWD